MFLYVASRVNGFMLPLIGFALVFIVFDPAKMRIPLLIVTALVLFRVVRFVHRRIDAMRGVQRHGRML